MLPPIATRRTEEHSRQRNWEKSFDLPGTTGAGDAFCAGVSIGLTYGKTLRESIEIGSQLAASVITSSENVCPRFLPRELGLDIEVED